MRHVTRTKIDKNFWSSKIDNRLPAPPVSYRVSLANEHVQVSKITTAVHYDVDAGMDISIFLLHGCWLSKIGTFTGPRSVPVNIR